MEQLNAQAIQAAWRSDRRFYDPYSSNSAHRSHPVDRSTQIAAIKDICTRLQGLKAQVPAYFNDGHYSWAFDAAAYDSSYEAALQMRLLQMLSSYFAEQTRNGGFVEASNGIVVRRIYSTRFLPVLSAPRAVSSRTDAGIVWTLVPLAFEHFAGLVWNVFFSMYGRHDEEPSKRAEIVINNSSFLRVVTELISDGFKEDDLGREHAADVICSQEQFFSRARTHLLGTPHSGLESDIVYNLVEFALAHEAAYRLRGDVTGGAERDIDLISELSSDEKGFELYLSGKERRAALFEQSGGKLSPFEQLVIGPIVFQATQALLGALLEPLRFRIAGLGWLHRLNTSLSACDTVKLRERGERLFDLQCALLDYVASKGHRVKVADLSRITRVLTQMPAATRAIEVAVLSIPDHVLANACEICMMKHA